MSVLIETSAGNFVVDLFVDDCPKACENFVKLCKVRYYDGHLFFDVERNYWMRTGDPTATGRGGQSVFSLLENPGKTYFEDEIVRELRFDRPGLVCMASGGPNENGSSFLISMTAQGIEHLNGKKTIFGEIAEGLDTTLSQINELQVDTKYRPLRDVRILCTHILIDPFPDPPGLPTPFQLAANMRPHEEAVEPRIAFDEIVDEDEGLSTEELERKAKLRDAKSRAVVLEMVGDLPDADVKPPENVLFVCKLNSSTQEDDLELIFSRFGEVKSCEIIRDKESGESLQYAFIEFGTPEQCQEAFFRMNNVMIDDRRIKVDFSQSVSKVWNEFARGNRRQLPPETSAQYGQSGFKRQNPEGPTRSHSKVSQHEVIPRSAHRETLNDGRDRTDRPSHDYDRRSRYSRDDRSSSRRHSSPHDDDQSSRDGKRHRNRLGSGDRNEQVSSRRRDHYDSSKKEERKSSRQRDRSDSDEGKPRLTSHRRRERYDSDDSGSESSSSSGHRHKKRRRKDHSYSRKHHKDNSKKKSKKSHKDRHEKKSKKSHHHRSSSSRHYDD